jgi:ABC-type antimicrobial peptide transport system permease subunit
MKNKCSTIKDFKKLSIQSYKDIRCGMILYSGDNKIKIISDVYTNECFTLWVDVEIISKDGYTHKDSLSLADNNVTNGGYNPWMLFKDKKIAKEHNKINWIIESKKDKYSGESYTILEKAPIGEVLTKDFIKSNFTINQLLIANKHSKVVKQSDTKNENINMSLDIVYSSEKEIEKPTWPSWEVREYEINEYNKEREEKLRTGELELVWVDTWGMPF